MRRTNGSGYDFYPIIKACCYIALIIAGLLIFVNNLLRNILKVYVDWAGWGYLNMIKEIMLLVGIGFGAYSFTRGKKIWVAVLFWIALVLYIASVILGVF